MTRWSAAVLAVILAVVLVRTAVLEPVTIGSQSMAPTLRHGGTALLDKITYRVRAPRRGDVIGFRSPEDGRLTIKRVVALAGDTVEIRDAVLYVDDRVVVEPQVDQAADDGTFFGPVTVPADAVFLLGDNRADSIDSRSYGAVPLADVRGRVLS